MPLNMPHAWNPYPHQRNLWNYLDHGGKRAVAVWHRRAGKDSTAINWCATEAITNKGVYWHMLPTQRQARKVIWDGIDRAGRRVKDQAFPFQIVGTQRSQEMQFELVNGSIWQLCGSDNYNSLVGANPRGVIFSEWSLCDPKAWDYVRPILAENEGWAIFIFTPRGKNHGHKMAQMARRNKNWFYSCLTVDDTCRDDGQRIISEAAIDEDRESGMTEDMIQQEYYCSFEVAIPGAYFADEIAAARADKRIRFIPIEPYLPVHTFWDIGLSKGNSTVIWFVQALGQEIRVINHYEAENEPMSHYINYVWNFEKSHGIHYGEHFAPHDIAVRSMMTGKSRIDEAREMGIVFRMVPRTKDLNESINTTKRLFPRCWFDEDRCENGIAALASYHREWNDKKQCYDDHPYHDWASNSADAFRQMAQAWNDRLALTKRVSPGTVQARMDFSIF